MDYSLRSDVAEAACSHLSVHGVAHGVELLIVLLGAVVGDHHSIGDHHSRVSRGRRV